MKLWVKTWQVPPPRNVTILAVYGASIVFVAYSPWWDQWTVIAPGAEQKIAEGPERWLCDSQWASEHWIKDAVEPVRLHKPTGGIPRRSKKGKQLALKLQ